jgi:hypothetical protein
VSLLGEVAELGQLIKEFLQISVGDLVLETGNERLGFFGVVATQTSYSTQN